MSKTFLLDYDFAEDHLPPYQSPIFTKAWAGFKAYVDNLLAYPLCERRPIGAVLADAGRGKTIAVTLYIESLPINAHTGLPRAIKIHLKPYGTAAVATKDLLEILGENSRRRNRWEAMDEVARSLVRLSIDLVFIDEADYMNDELFDLLRYLRDKVKCTIILVGLPDTEALITRREKFKSRCFESHRLAEMDWEEFFNEILPNIGLPHWKCDIHNKDDEALAALIWEYVKPSFRNLVSLLESAESIAVEDNQEQIDFYTIVDSIERIRGNYKSRARVITKLEEEASRFYEEESERRKAETQRKEERKQARKREISE